MDLSEIIKIAQLAAIIISAIVAIGGGYAMWRLAGVFAKKSDVEELKKILEGVRAMAQDAEHHVELLEERLKAVPDGDDIAELRNTLFDVTQGLGVANTKLEGVDGRFKRVEGWIEATSKGVEWIKNHMIEVGK